MSQPHPPLTEPPALYTYAELAELWRVSERTIQRWIMQDRFNGIRIGKVRRETGPRPAFVMLVRGDEAVGILRRHMPSLFAHETRLTP